MGGGQGKLQGKIIRIGHLGNISIEDLKQGLAALVYSLHEMDSQTITDTQTTNRFRLFKRDIKPLKLMTHFYFHKREIIRSFA